MSKKAEGIPETKLKKFDKPLKKPYEVVKKLKNHFNKTNKKITTTTTDAAIINADVASRTINVSQPIADRTQNIIPPRYAGKIHNDALNHQMPNVSRSGIDQILQNSDKVDNRFHIDGLSRKMEMSQSSEMVNKIDLQYNDKETDKSSILNNHQSVSETMDHSPQARTSQSFLMSSEDIQAKLNISASCVKVEQPKNDEVGKLDDAVIEQQLAELNQCLKTLADMNEKSKKHEEELLANKNQILIKIDVVKKQISEAMDRYRDTAHSCREKIEKEEILQNEMLMDLKERIDKLNDMCTDINKQVDDMLSTLNAHNVGETNAVYMITAYSVDFIMRFLQQIYATIISITKTYYY